MLTKGDVLKALGKVNNVYGSAEKLNLAVMGPSGVRKGEVSHTEARIFRADSPRNQLRVPPLPRQPRSLWTAPHSVVSFSRA